jgi:hypothetical protein
MSSANRTMLKFGPGRVGDGPDPGALLSGHNGSAQKFDCISSQVIERPSPRAQMREMILRDQWQNIYLVYRTTLFGELYDVRDWIKPSQLAHFGGLNLTLLDSYRAKAFEAFDKMASEIVNGRGKAVQAKLDAAGGKN